MLETQEECARGEGRRKSPRETLKGNRIERALSGARRGDGWNQGGEGGGDM